MNASLVTADRATHVRIAAMSLAAAIIAVWLVAALH